MLFTEKELSWKSEGGKVINQPLFHTTLESGGAYHEKYRKGDVLLFEDTPDREGLQAFYEKPEFPAGTYEIKVQADFNLDRNLGKPHLLSVPLTVKFK
ncbi:hypothetical protein [Gorillibacterium timonense]|uniref:hypothetical protein n=1 Tax=Gorillibacterium timonense TaxID=1689269 RepID=UPI0011DC9893|nr:hypothetical protein [Gorillibacterium timonense]